jgi:transposase InsO family protein
MRHGSGLELITDQGRNFVIFGETCKILGIQKTHTSSFHSMSNGLIERWHRLLHDGLSHFVSANNTNWDNLIQFYLMSYRAIPNNITGYSPFYLLHGWEMTLPNHANLKAKVTEENPDHKQRLERLKSSLKLIYDAVTKANKASHHKRLYDRKAKVQHFKVGDLVYLYNPSVKLGLTKKFSRAWTGPYRITKRLSELNCEI